MARDKAVSSVTTAAVLDTSQGTIQRRGKKEDGAKKKVHVRAVAREATTAGSVGLKGDATTARKRVIWREIAKKGNNHDRMNRQLRSSREQSRKVNFCFAE